MVRAVAQKKSHLRNCRWLPSLCKPLLTPCFCRLKDFQDPQESLWEGKTGQRVSSNYRWLSCVLINDLQIVGWRSLELMALRTRERSGEYNLLLQRLGMGTFIVDHKFLIYRKAARQLLTLDEKDTKRVFEGMCIIFNIELYLCANRWCPYQKNGQTRPFEGVWEKIGLRIGSHPFPIHGKKTPNPCC